LEYICKKRIVTKIKKHNAMRKTIFLISAVFFILYGGRIWAQADAGPDQTICTNSTYMDAVGNVGDGTWSVIQGTGTFENDQDPHTLVTNIGPGVNKYRWTVTSGSNTYTDDVTIINNTPTQADAGTDQTLCQDFYSLQANSPAAGETGQWSILSGGGIFSDITDPNATISQLPQGTTVLRWTITKEGCTSYDDVTITNDLPDQPFAGYDQELCADNTTLEATPVNIGTGTWQVLSGNANIANVNDPHSSVTNLAQGANILQWTVTHNGCSLHDEVIIVNNLPDQPDAGTDQTICADNTTLNANNPTIGTGHWSVISGNAVIDDPSSNTPNVTSLAQGENTFRWTITNNGCSLYDEVTITNDLPDNPFAGYDQIICSDSTTLEATPLNIGNGHWEVTFGSATFADANDPNTVVTGLQQGENNLVWVAVHNSCTLTDNVIIRNDLPDQPVAGVDTTICADNITLYANTPTIGQGFWSVISGNAIIADTSSATSAVTQIAQGENILRWTITNNNCSLFDDITITNDLPDQPFAGYDKVICYDTLTLEATPLIIGNGQWSIAQGSMNFDDNTKPNALASNIQQGTNIIVWTATHNSCSLSDTVVIRNDRPTIPVAGVDSAICADSITLYANTPSIGHGEWSVVNGYGVFQDVHNPNSFVSQLPRGQNTLRWTITNNDCALFDDVVITNDLPSDPDGGDYYLTCADSLQLNAVEPQIGNGIWSALDTNIAFNDPSLYNAMAYNLPQGIDTLVWTTLHNACSLSDTVLVYSSQLVESNTHQDLSCYQSNDGSVNITVSGGFNPYSYYWTNNIGDLPYTSQNLSNIPADTYMVAITDSIGCQIFDTIVVTQPEQILPNATITNVLCHDDSTGSIVLNPTGGVGGYSYSWAVVYDSTHYSVMDSTENHLYNMIAGVYGVRVTDSSGCFVDEQYEIKQPAQISLSAVVVDNVCYDAYDGSIDLTVQGGTPAYDGYTYVWSEQNDSIVHYYDPDFVAYTEDLSNLHAGTYTVTVTDLNNCQMTATYHVDQPFQGILLEGNVTDVSCKDQHDGAIDLTVTYGTPPYTYLWSNGETSEDLEELDGGTYIVTVTDIYGCTETDTFVVNITPIECLHVYNAFSPNGDGVNDTWEIDNIYLYPNCVVKVFNQWGNTVFYSEGYQTPWDGTFNGQPLPAGTYYYIIDLGNGDKPFKGDVTIIR
jgi:gliding motility-associated-like protein